jgi:hypothetical protein
VTTPAAEDSPLAAMITAVADGKPVTALDIAKARVEAIDQALRSGVTWAAIGAIYGISGREAKKKIHGLREQVKRAERLGSRP